MAEKTEPKKEPHKESRPVEHRAQAQAAQEPQKSASGKEIRGIVRIAGKDIRGHVKLARALQSVKGVGNSYGSVISEIATSDLGVQPTTAVGELSESQLERIEHIMTHPAEFGVPPYMLNRRKDFQTGTDRHLIGTDLTFTVKQDIEHEKEMVSWRGYRHSYGQKVRGQRTRSTGRTGMTVGVLRKAVLAKAGAAAATAAAGAQAAAAPTAAGAKGAAPAAAKGAAPASGAKAPAAAGIAPAAAKPAEKKK